MIWKIGIPGAFWTKTLYFSRQKELRCAYRDAHLWAPWMISNCPSNKELYAYYAGKGPAGTFRHFWTARRWPDPVAATWAGVRVFVRSFATKPMHHHLRCGITSAKRLLQSLERMKSRDGQMRFAANLTWTMNLPVALECMLPSSLMMNWRLWFSALGQMSTYTSPRNGAGNQRAPSRVIFNMSYTRLSSTSAWISEWKSCGSHQTDNHKNHDTDTVEILHHLGCKITCK